MRKHLNLALVVALLALVYVSSAYAYRSPTRSERRQIVAAIDRFLYTQNCAPTHTCNPKVTNIRVSLANQTFATAHLFAPKVGSALALLHRKYGTWRLTDLGTQFVGCSGKAPKAVRVDLELTCPGGR